MNHKYSTYTLLLFFFSVVGLSVLGELSSEEIDYVCDQDNHTLFRYNGAWGCANLMDSGFFNITVNNITNIYNNYSLYTNNSNYVDWSGILNVPSGLDDGDDYEADTRQQADNNFLYNDSNTIYFNDTLLNDTIDGRSTSGIWTNDSGVANYDGNVNITGNLSVVWIGLDGMQPTAPISYKNFSSKYKSLIDIGYGIRSSLASPFKYNITIPNSTTDTTITAINLGYLNMIPNFKTTGSEYLYANYMFFGQGSTIPKKGNFNYGFDILKTDFPQPAFNEHVGGDQLLVGYDVQLTQPLTLSSTVNGTSIMIGSKYKYVTKANNLLGGSRSYTSMGYVADGFTGCESYDECYGFFANNSDSKFIGDVNITGDIFHGDEKGLTSQLVLSNDDGSPCNLNFSGGLFIGTNCTTI